MADAGGGQGVPPPPPKTLPKARPLPRPLPGAPSEQSVASGAETMAPRAVRGRRERKPAQGAGVAGALPAATLNPLAPPFCASAAPPPAEAQTAPPTEYAIVPKGAGRGGGRGRGRGGKGKEAAVEENATPHASGGRGRGRGRGGAVHAPWWRTLEGDDPITLEPLCELAYPPFELAVDDSKRSYFDGRALAEYLTAARLFQNPLSRRPLERADCERLDAYIRRHKLGRHLVTVTRTFDDAAAAAAASVAGTADALAAERAAAAEALLHAFYAGGSRNRDARRHGGGGTSATPRPVAPAVQTDGRGFVLMDDDVAMTRGASRSAVEASAVARVQTQSLAACLGGNAPLSGEAFPALPHSAAPAAPAWPALSRTAAHAPALSSAADSDSTAAERFRPSWWAHAAPAPPPSRPPAGAATAAAARAAPETDSGAELRRRQLADAFGVDDPDRRPSMFAASSAEAFSALALATARAEPSFVTDLEARFDAALAARSRRTSLPPMCRSKRRVVHEMAHTYGIVSSSYGEGASRHVDIFVLPVSGHPSIRLSDALRAPPPPPVPATPAPTSAAIAAALSMRFTAVTRDANLARVLAGLGVEYTLSWLSPSEALATFNSTAALEEAKARLGAGLRGLFRVAHADAAAATVPAPAPARRTTAGSDPWSSSSPREPPPPLAAQTRRPLVTQADWETSADATAPVTLRPLHVPIVNRWGALQDPEGSDGGGGGGDDDGGVNDAWDAGDSGDDGNGEASTPEAHAAAPPAAADE